MLHSNNINLCFQRDKPAGEPDKPAGEPDKPGGAPGGFIPPGRKIPVARPPRYTSRNVGRAYSLRYDWTGWPTEGAALPSSITDVAQSVASVWETDGLHLLESHAMPGQIQLLFSATPDVSPVFFCHRVKGRLQHALRQAGVPVVFSRKVSFRSLGENTTPDVDGYLRKQVRKEGFADCRFEGIMGQFTVVCHEVSLAEPSETASGRYWYNLHLVLVVADRFRLTKPAVLGSLRDATFRVAGETGCRIGALAVMPDHVHVALRGDVNRSPDEIAVAFQNGMARAAGCQVWQDGYYVGTFSEYALDVIRRITGGS